MEAASFIHDFMLDKNLFEEVANFKMQPFHVQVQTARRTFIDKLFALADYYMSNQPNSHSRHLYDIYKIYPNIKLDDDFFNLVEDVRNARKHHKTCLSAKDGVNLPEVLEMLLTKDFFKADYESITELLLFERVSYEETYKVLKLIIKEALKGKTTGFR